MGRTYTDPVTGDTLTLGEHISWLIQSLIRRWAFIGTITVVTALWWTFPATFHDPGRAWWNLCASWLALFIESVVGIAMFSQTKRDALIIRRVLALEEQMLAVLTHCEGMTEHLEKLFETSPSWGPVRKKD